MRGKVFRNSGGVGTALPARPKREAVGIIIGIEGIKIRGIGEGIEPMLMESLPANHGRRTPSGRRTGTAPARQRLAGLRFQLAVWQWRHAVMLVAGGAGRLVCFLAEYWHCIGGGGAHVIAVFPCLIASVASAAAGLGMISMPAFERSPIDVAPAPADSKMPVSAAKP